MHRQNKEINAIIHKILGFGAPPVFYHTYHVLRNVSCVNQLLINASSKQCFFYRGFGGRPWTGIRLCLSFHLAAEIHLSVTPPVWWMVAKKDMYIFSKSNKNEVNTAQSITNDINDSIPLLMMMGKKFITIIKMWIFSGMTVYKHHHRSSYSCTRSSFSSLPSPLLLSLSPSLLASPHVVLPYRER